MKQATWQYVGLAAICVLVVGLGVITFGNKFGWLEKPEVAQAGADSTPEDTRPNSPSTRSDGNTPGKPVSTSSESVMPDLGPALQQAKRLRPDPGRSPVVNANANPNTRYLAQHIDDPEHPEVRSVMFQPEPFDRASYEADPQAYLDRFEPGRIWQASDSEAAPHVKRVGSFYRRLLQGESTRLQARTEPGMPVTFYSGQLGQFANELSAVTVQADDQGVAETTYTATGGTHGEIVILASSPVAQGQTRFVVKVDLPMQPVDLDGASSLPN